MIGAEIGVTPFISVLKYLKTKIKEGSSPVKKVYFFWIARTHHNMTWFSETLKEIEDFNLEQNENTFEITNYITSFNQTKDQFQSSIMKGALNFFFSKKKKMSSHRSWKSS